MHSITTPLVAERCLAVLMKRSPGEQNFPPQLTKTLRNVGSLRFHLMVRSFCKSVSQQGERVWNTKLMDSRVKP